MKSKIKNRIVKVAQVLFGMGLALLLVYANIHQANKVCTEVNISIDHVEGNRFVDEDYVLGLLENIQNGGFIGHSVRNIDVEALEGLISQVDYIDNAEVYVGHDGNIEVDVKEKNPIIRVINKEGVSYYIDKEGNRMAFSNNFTSRVLVANGEILTTDFEHVSQVGGVVEELYAIATKVSEDPYLKSIMLQVYVNKDKEFEMISLLGSHVILFGEANRVEEKFENLLSFYKASTSVVDLEKYKLVSLKFKDQIVCTKF